MAKRKKTRTITKIVRTAAPAAPIVIKTPRAAPARRRARRRRSSGGGVRSSVGGLVSNETLQMAVGGALYGFIVKAGIIAKLPAIPVVGRTGTAALLLDYWSRHGGGLYAARAAKAAASIAGYQLGHDGAIQGDMMLGDLVTMGDDATTPGSLAGDDMDGYE